MVKHNLQLGDIGTSGVQVLGQVDSADRWQHQPGVAPGPAIRAALATARDLCLRTLAAIDGNKAGLTDLAAKCFLLDAQGFAQNKPTIRGVIQKTSTGLQGETVIKVDLLGKLGPRGYIRRRDPLTESDIEFNEAMGEVRYRNGLENTVHKEGGTTQTRMNGAIHVSSYLLTKPPLNLVQVLIHEATHRHAGTHDSVVQGDTLGYMKKTLEFRKTGITPQLALYNADSHAWFIVKAGQAFDGLITGIAH